jgi:hypothetical protein
MSLTNEEIKKILDGAPDGATHYDTHRHGFKYWAIKMDFTTHNLSDLAEILALRERVEGLEQELDRYKDNPFIIPLAPKGEHQ